MTMTKSQLAWLACVEAADTEAYANAFAAFVEAVKEESEADTDPADWPAWTDDIRVAASA
jgi:hypothetical protein